MNYLNCSGILKVTCVIFIIFLSVAQTKAKPTQSVDILDRVQKEFQTAIVESIEYYTCDEACERRRKLHERLQEAKEDYVSKSRKQMAAKLRKRGSSILKTRHYFSY